MFRQLYMTFFGEFRGTPEQEHHLHEAPPSMALVLAVLAMLSAVGGFAMLPEFIAPFAPLERFLDPVFSSAATREVLAAGLHDRALETLFAGLSLLVVAVGWLLADLTYRRGVLSAARMSEFAGGLFYRLCFEKYRVDEFYRAAFVDPYLTMTKTAAWFDAHIIDSVVNLVAAITVFGAWLSGRFDNHVVDGLVNFTSNATLAAGGRLRRLQTGSINGYLYGILAAVMIILLVRTIVRV
jgi:NADH-quinone oxidoreductase subunit L